MRLCKYLPNGNQVSTSFAAMVRLIIGAMFIISSLSKIQRPFDFLSSVYSYELAGPRLGLIVAIVLPWMELIVGICLVGGVFVGGALLVSVAMGILFTIVVGSAIYRELDISCGCFSAGGARRISILTLVRAVLIVLFSAGAYVLFVLVRTRDRTVPAVCSHETTVGHSVVDLNSVPL
jgi:uncharacterized membrane protein YphA (DoxX/SURF4 family)